MCSSQQLQGYKVYSNRSFWYYKLWYKNKNQVIYTVAYNYTYIHNINIPLQVEYFRFYYTSYYLGGAEIGYDNFCNVFMNSVKIAYTLSVELNV